MSVPGSRVLAGAGRVDFREGSGLPIIGLGFDVRLRLTSTEIPLDARLRAENVFVEFCGE